MEQKLDRTLEARIKLYYDLRPGTHSPAPLLIALHGYGGNKSQMLREAQLIAAERFAIVSLQGFHQHIKEPREPGGPLRFGFGWLKSYRSEESVQVHHQAVIDLISNLTCKVRCHLRSRSPARWCWRMDRCGIYVLGKRK